MPAVQPLLMIIVWEINSPTHRPYLEEKGLFDYPLKHGFVSPREGQVRNGAFHRKTFEEKPTQYGIFKPLLPQ
jgi:hypothetical protein